VPLSLRSIQLRDQSGSSGVAVPLVKVITSVTALASDPERLDSSVVMVLATADAKLLMTTYDPVKGN